MSGLGGMALGIWVTGALGWLLLGIMAGLSLFRALFWCALWPLVLLWMFGDVILEAVQTTREERKDGE